MAVNLNSILLFFMLTAYFAVASEREQEEHSVSVKEVVFIIRSQKHPFHAERAKLVKADIEQQCRLLGLDKPLVVILSDEYPEMGQWVLLPLLPRLQDAYVRSEYKWVFFCEDETRVKIPGLLQVLKRYDPSERWFLGKELRDKEATIIHHYKFHNNPTIFAFPDFEAGWLLSIPLLEILGDRWEKPVHHMDFTIDVKHELAIFIWDEDNGVKLTHVPELCSGNLGSNDPPTDDNTAKELMEKENKETEKRRRRKKGTEIVECVTSYPIDIPQCGQAVPKKNMYFAVKTCEKFHKTRVPVVKETWGQYVEHITYFSEKDDPSIPTLYTGIPNTERGHCGKTFYIFQHFKDDPWLKKIPWLVITDDDTILSVSRLQRLLSCYNPDEPVFLGERYGFGHTKSGWGYDYITGGGGMIFSRAAVIAMLEQNCKCRSDADPDDMIIGSCIKRIGHTITHSPFLHQARPDDYVAAFLQHQTPVSFHKHWNNDPYKVYEDWFAVDDIKGDLVLDIQGESNQEDTHSNNEAEEKQEDKATKESNNRHYEL
ncbi:beta-1,3-glucosyltransferase-like [Glandiceps talaboti]